jgi:hypothetical protein
VAGEATAGGGGDGGAGGHGPDRVLALLPLPDPHPPASLGLNPAARPTRDPGAEALFESHSSIPGVSAAVTAATRMWVNRRPRQPVIPVPGRLRCMI